MKSKKTTLLFIALIDFFSFQLLAQKKFVLADMDKLYTLTDPQLSPDRQSVLVVVSKPDTTIMIFIPSVGGISHSPKDFTKAVDMANGANVLLQTILKLDKE